MQAPMSLVWLIDVLGSSTMILMSIYGVRLMKEVYRKRRYAALYTFLYAQTLALAVFAISRSVAHIVKRVLMTAGYPDVWHALSPVSGGINSITFIVFALSALLYSNVRAASEKVDALEKRERELKRSKREYQDLYDYAPDMFGSVDARTGKIIQCNHTLAATLGYSKDELVGRPVSDIYHMECVEDPGKDGLLFVETDEADNAELQLKRKDGSRIDVSLKVSAVRDEHGNVLFCRCIWRDITDRKRAERALQESEAKHRSLTNDVLDSSGVGIVILDSGFRIVWLNLALEQFFGLRREDIIGMDNRRLVRERIKYIFEEPEAFAERILETYEDNTSIRRFECHVLPEGERKERHLEHWSQPIRSGLYAGGRIEFYTDVTGRKKTEEQLRKLFHAVEQSPSSVIITDTRGNIEYVNPRFTELTGYACEEVIGRNPRLLKSSHHPPEFYRELWKTITSGGVWTGELYNRKKNGELYWEHTCISPITDADGTITHFVALKEDVTQKKFYEEEKKRLQIQLLQAQKMEAIGKLSGGVAHDFNNLLTAIMGYSELVLDSFGDQERLRKNVEEIRKSAERAASLTRQLLAFSRRQVLQTKVLDINDLVTDIKKLLFRLIGEDIELATELAADLPKVKIDPAQIEQVVMNLAINARDAMQHGGILTIRTENVVIDEASSRLIPYSRPGSFVCLTVEDTGEGMDKDVIQHIFEPFFTTKDVGKGTGLGLAVVYGIVKQHEGWINVQSEEGKGTSFKVYLPACRAMERSEHKTRDIPKEELNGKGERILLVEDEEIVLRSCASLLRKNGYTVFETTNAKEAMDTFEREKDRIHLVCSDVVLPDENGVQLVNRLLSSKPDLRVLLTSGYTGRKSQLELIREKGFRFLQKPYTLTDLLRAIRELIEGNTTG